MAVMRVLLSLCALAILGVVGCSPEDATDHLGTSSDELSGSLTLRRGTQGTIADTFVSATEMKKNYGPQHALRVSAKNEVLVRFELGSIPANAVIDTATLTVFINGGDDEQDDDCEDGD